MCELLRQINEVDEEEAMNKIIKDYKSDLRFEREENQRLQSQNYKLQNRVDKLHNWILSKFDWWPELLKDGKTPCLKYLIKETAKILGADVQNKP